MDIVFPFPRTHYPELSGFEEYFFELTERDLAIFAFNYVLHRNMLGQTFTELAGALWLGHMLDAAIYQTVLRSDERLESALRQGLRYYPCVASRRAEILNSHLDYEQLLRYAQWVDALSRLFYKIYADCHIFSQSQIEPMEIEIMNYQRLNNDAYILHIEDKRDIGLIRELLHLGD